MAPASSREAPDIQEVFSFPKICSSTTLAGYQYGGPSISNQNLRKITNHQSHRYRTVQSDIDAELVVVLH